MNENMEYYLIYDGGTEQKPISIEGATAILITAEYRGKNLSWDEKQEVTASLIESNPESDTLEDGICLAYELDGKWYLA